MASAPFSRRLFNLLSDANAPKKDDGSTCANRMLRMRETADGLLIGRVGPGSAVSGLLLPHSTASALRRQKTRLAAVPFTVIYIVGAKNYFFLIEKLGKLVYNKTDNKNNCGYPFDSAQKSSG